jgi:integrase
LWWEKWWEEKIAVPKLRVAGLKSLNEPRMYADGDGLYLNVSKSGTKSWIFRATVKGLTTTNGTPLRVEKGLGSVKNVTLADARINSRVFHEMARAGINPVDDNSKEILTFRDAALRVHSNLSPTWRNKKHTETWLATVENYANSQIGNRPIEQIGTADILRILSPIWIEKHETAKRLKQRISTIFDWAKGAGHYQSENPVNGIKMALPRVKRQARHLAALPWQEIPTLMTKLKEREGMSARTVEFIIFTATRSGEARGARWREIEGNIWTIPAERMKRGVAHRIPLSDDAINVLDRVRGMDTDLIFPSVQRGKKGEARTQSVMVFKALFSRMGWEGFTTHGFRSSFRDWCSESAHADWEVAETALAHAVGNESERAYARSDLLERRKVLMNLWGHYATGKSGDVIPMVRA